VFHLLVVWEFPHLVGIWSFILLMLVLLVLVAAFPFLQALQALVPVVWWIPTLAPLLVELEVESPLRLGLGRPELEGLFTFMVALHLWVDLSKSVVGSGFLLIAGF
jgi:hypothetical protein